MRSWGGEDPDLGFRLHRGGATCTVSREAWALDTPHERSVKDDLTSGADNVLMMVRKHPEPVTELLRAWFTRAAADFEISDEGNPDDDYLVLLCTTERARGKNVEEELARLRALPARTRVVVLVVGLSFPMG